MAPIGHANSRFSASMADVESLGGALKTLLGKASPTTDPGKLAKKLHVLVGGPPSGEDMPDRFLAGSFSFWKGVARRACLAQHHSKHGAARLQSASDITPVKRRKTRDDKGTTREVVVVQRPLPQRISVAAEQLQWAQTAGAAIRTRSGACTAVAVASAENPIASSDVWRSNVAMLEEGIDFDA